MTTKEFGTVYCGAGDCAPQTCHCEHSLAKPTYGWIEIGASEFDRKYEFPTELARKVGECWHIVCKCNARFVWGYHEGRNGAWFCYPVWPMLVRKLLQDNGKRYTKIK